MDDETVLDEGVYCRDCCYFEQPEIENGRCMACGCDEDMHSDAKVVEK